MPDKASNIFHNALLDAGQTVKSLGDLAGAVEKGAAAVGDCLLAGGKLLVCGNGGSAADAADFATEFACRFAGDRRPYPALNLSQGGSLLTATANDYGFDEVFARQVTAFGLPGDVLVAISTSGKSANIRRALEQGKKQKLKTIALLGRDGAACRGIADIDLIVKGDATARIQEAHKFLLHVICEIVEPELPRA